MTHPLCSAMWRRRRLCFRQQSKELPYVMAAEKFLRDCESLNTRVRACGSDKGPAAPEA